MQNPVNRVPYSYHGENRMFMLGIAKLYRQEYHKVIDSNRKSMMMVGGPGEAI